MHLSYAEVFILDAVTAIAVTFFFNYILRRRHKRKIKQQGITGYLSSYSIFEGKIYFTATLIDRELIDSIDRQQLTVGEVVFKLDRPH